MIRIYWKHRPLKISSMEYRIAKLLEVYNIKFDNVKKSRASQVRFKIITYMPLPKTLYFETVREVITQKIRAKLIGYNYFDSKEHAFRKYVFEFILTQKDLPIEPERADLWSRLVKQENDLDP